MKIALSKFSFLISVAFISLLSASFTQSYVWLDENHNQVTQENGKFYRPIPEKKRSVYLIVDFYKNGTKYREGKAESLIANKEVFKGFVTYFYPDGSISKKEKYKNGFLDGPYKEFYPTGEVKVEGVMERGLSKEPGKYIISQEKSKQKESIEMVKKLENGQLFTAMCTILIKINFIVYLLKIIPYERPFVLC